MTVLELKRYLHKGIPVIILLQGLSDKKISDWRNTWTEGHYVIANGIDNKKIYFEDPWHKPIKSLAFAELEERWHDIIKGHKYRYRGIAVFGQK
jgi:predicted double-glycine peptidase